MMHMHDVTNLYVHLFSRHVATSQTAGVLHTAVIPRLPLALVGIDPNHRGGKVDINASGILSLLIRRSLVEELGDVT